MDGCLDLIPVIVLLLVYVYLYIVGDIDIGIDPVVLDNGICNDAVYMPAMLHAYLLCHIPEYV